MTMFMRPEDRMGQPGAPGLPPMPGTMLPPNMQPAGDLPPEALTGGAEERQDNLDIQKEQADKLGKIDEKALQKATEILRKYKAGKFSIDQRIISCQEWWKLNNWQEQARDRRNGRTGVEGPSTQTRSSTAWLWNCIIGKHADCIDSYPEPVILPKAQDDQEEAVRLASVVPVILDANGFEETYSECAWQKLQEGTGAYGVFWDKNKLNGLGDVTIRKINVLNLFWEPGVGDIQESRHVFHVALMDTDLLEDQYPEAKGKLKSAGETVAQYRYDDNVDTTDKSVVIDWYYHRYQGGRRVLHYCKFVGDTVLYATENDPQRKETGLYADAEFPFVLDPLFPVEGQPTGYGLIDIGKDTQKDIDMLSQAIVLNSTMSATPRYFVRKDGGVNEKEFADWSKPLVHTNNSLGSDTLQQILVNPISGNIVSVLQQKIDELKFITGNTDVNNGGVPSGVTAASAIAALKEDAGRTSMDSTKAAYRAFKRVVTMIIERVRQFYDLPRQFRIMGKDGGMSFESYSNRQLQPQPMGILPGSGEMSYRLPAFDIEVRAQRENAYTKMSQNELALQFYGQGFFNPQLTDQALMAIDMMEFKGKDELAQKIAEQGTMAQMLQQYQQIALALAQKYEPDMAEQLAQNIMGRAAGGGPVPTGGGIAPNQSAAVKPTDETANAEKQATESKQNQRMRERVANATRPD